jgi:ribosomal protein L13E
VHHIKPSIQKPDGKHRKGRGFSIQELVETGLNKAEAKKLKIPVDPRRKTAHNKNIADLKSFLENQKKQTTSKTKTAQQVQEQSNKKPKK